MNIFAIDSDPIIAGSHLNDRHTIKMVVESAQLLANCFSPEMLASRFCPRTKTGNVRKYSNRNHPSSLWARAALGNFNWLLDHSFALLVEYRARYNKWHFCQDFLNWVETYRDDNLVPSGSLQDFAIAIPQDAKCRKDPNFEIATPVEKYRLYYKYDKNWTWRRNKPNWLK